MIFDDWRELCGVVLDTAEGYATVDPGNAHLYRQEAKEFVDLTAPLSDLGMRQMEAEADAIKARWRARVRRKKKP